MNSNLYIWNKRVSQSCRALRFRKLFYLWSAHFTFLSPLCWLPMKLGTPPPFWKIFNIGPLCPAFPRWLESCLLVRASVRNIKSVATALGRVPSLVPILSVPFSSVRIQPPLGHGNVSGNNSFATVASLNQLLSGVIHRDGTSRGLFWRGMQT